jgi:hypothetical protein
VSLAYQTERDDILAGRHTHVLPAVEIVGHGRSFPEPLPRSLPLPVASSHANLPVRTFMARTTFCRGSSAVGRRSNVAAYPRLVPTPPAAW